MTGSNPFMSLTPRLFWKRRKSSRYYNYYYNKYEARYLDNNLYLRFLRNVKDRNSSVMTDIDINLTPSLNLESSTLSDVKSAFGKPLYTFSRMIRNSRVNVLLYKLKLLDYKVVTELHFFEDKLYYFVYNFVDTNESERKTIVNKVLNKYGVESDAFNYSNCFLMDSNENCIIFNDNVDFSINYFNISASRAFDFFSNMLEKSENLNKRKKNFKEKMFYKLI